MDIEEERKAFEAICQKGRSENWIDGPFNIWLAAKRHAEEMAKQTVVINESHYGWSVSLTDNGTFNGVVKDEMASAEEARVWATSNGYRVIEQ